MNNRIWYNPRNVGISFVRGCNFTCRMCPVTANIPNEPQRFQFMQVEMLRKIVAEIDRWPSIEVIWFFNFGEPLAHPRYRQCLEILNGSTVAQNAVVIQYTNGSLLEGDKAKAILEVPIINKLVISFDGFGDAASFEVLRGPHYDKVLENIRRFSDEASRVRPNLSLAVSSIIPRPGEVPGLTTISLGEATEHLETLFNPLNVQVETRHMHDYSGNDPLEISGKRPVHIRGGCSFVEHDHLNITINGFVQPCCSVYDENFTVGHIAEASFGSLLNSEKMNDLRHHLRLDQRDKLPYCNNCALSLGAMDDIELRTFWIQRDKRGFLDDLSERKYIYEEILEETNRTIRLDLGSGRVTEPGFIGCDHTPNPNVQVVLDLNHPLPFVADSVNLVTCIHSLEHVTNLPQTMDEIYRVSKHGAELYIFAPYDQQSINRANPYHNVSFNEHTPRFWTETETNPFIDQQIYRHPRISRWGLRDSGNTKVQMDFRCTRMEIFYYPEFRSQSEEEKLRARTRYLNVCDSITYNLLVIKEDVSKSRLIEMEAEMDYYEHPYITHRKLREENKQLRQDLERLEEHAQKIQIEYHQVLEKYSAMLDLQSIKVMRGSSTIRLNSMREFVRALQFKNAWDQVAPQYIQLKDDTSLFGGNLRGYRLWLNTVSDDDLFLEYELMLERDGLIGVLIAPVVYPGISGMMGIEIISPKPSIVVHQSVPVASITPDQPVRFAFSPLPTSSGVYRLRIFTADLNGKIGLWEMWKPTVLRSRRRKPFAGYVFE